VHWKEQRRAELRSASLSILCCAGLASQLEATLRNCSHFLKIAFPFCASVEALLPTPTLPVLTRTCWNNKSCYLSLTIHGIFYPKLVLYVIYFDLIGQPTTSFVSSSPGILFILCAPLGFVPCTTTAKDPQLSLLPTPGALSDICHQEGLAIHCNDENSPMLEQEQQVPSPLLSTSQSYKQHCTLLGNRKVSGRGGCPPRPC